MSTPAENPFSAARLRPGVLPFQFGDQCGIEQLLVLLESNNWRGEIIGPHGSGKSTLLAHLAAALLHRDCAVSQIELHDGQRRLPAHWRPDRQAARAIVTVDGCEQLSRLARLLLTCECRLRGWGLIVTAHRSLGFPRLYQTCVTPELAREIIFNLAGSAAPPLTDSELEAFLARHAGNLREVLFALYDRYEAQTPRKNNPDSAG